MQLIPNYERNRLGIVRPRNTTFDQLPPAQQDFLRAVAIEQVEFMKQCMSKPEPRDMAEIGKLCSENLGRCEARLPKHLITVFTLEVLPTVVKELS